MYPHSLPYSPIASETLRNEMYYEWLEEEEIRELQYLFYEFICPLTRKEQEKVEYC